MKKIQTIIKTMLIVGIVLVMAQGCIPTTPVGGNPTPNPNLIGKIKSSTWSSDLITISTNYNYEASGKVISFKSTYSQTNVSLIVPFTVEYQTNKVIVKDSTNIPVTVYYLHPNTNLIDSFDLYDHTPIRTIVERDALNNIVKIGNNNYGFTYENGNLKSFWDAGFWTPMSGYNYEFIYDFSKLSRVHTNPYSILGSTPSDFDFLGLSVGNTSTYAISSMSANVDFSMSSVNFTYTNYTPTNVSINITGSLSNSFIKWNSVNNIYY